MFVSLNQMLNPLLPQASKLLRGLPVGSFVPARLLLKPRQLARGKWIQKGENLGIRMGIGRVLVGRVGIHGICTVINWNMSHEYIGGSRQSQSPQSVAPKRRVRKPIA